MTETPDVRQFLARANEYCAFIETAHTLPLPQRLRVAQHRLLVLYAAGAQLPDVESDLPDDHAAPRMPIEPPPGWVGFDAFDAYWEVFDPYKNEDYVGGSLSDDLLDVYRDVCRGMMLWKSGKQLGAIWEWRFGFEIHWGDHAIDALRALHRACLRCKETG